MVYFLDRGSKDKEKDEKKNDQDGDDTEEDEGLKLSELEEDID